MMQCRLCDRVGEIAIGAIGWARDGFDWSRSRIQNIKTPTEALEKTKETAVDLYRRGGRAVDYARGGAAARPFLTLGVAAAIGYGLGYLARRR